MNKEIHFEPLQEGRMRSSEACAEFIDKLFLKRKSYASQRFTVDSDRNYIECYVVEGGNGQF